VPSKDAGTGGFLTPLMTARRQPDPAPPGPPPTPPPARLPPGGWKPRAASSRNVPGNHQVPEIPAATPRGGVNQFGPVPEAVLEYRAAVGEKLMAAEKAARQQLAPALPRAPPAPVLIPVVW
jgi:hypothetical protein